MAGHDKHRRAPWAPRTQKQEEPLTPEDERWNAIVKQATTPGIHNAVICFVTAICTVSIAAMGASGLMPMYQALWITVAVAFAGSIVLSLAYRKNIRSRVFEVREREELFSALATSTNDVFVSFDASTHTMQYVSPNVERLLGITPDEVVATPQVLLEADGRTEPWSLQEGSLHPIRHSVRIHRDTGEKRWFLETLYRTGRKGYERQVMILSDRTVEHRGEQALRAALSTAESANRSKSTFLSNMSHDIRTPMNAIVGLATLLRRDAHKPEAVIAHTDKIAASSEHLLELLNHVLDMARVESGELSLTADEFDLGEALTQGVGLVRAQAAAKHQRLELKIESASGLHVVGDRAHLRQVLANLLDNAVKYTPDEGCIRLAASVQELPGNFVNVRVAVSDNGIGMAPGYRDRVFKPFAREVQSVTNEVLGTGLGLAVTKSLVDLMGGTIEVESALGEGSTFTVSLRLPEAEPAEPVAVPEHTEDAPGISGLHFLAAEDNMMSACILEELLDMEGATVELACNGQEAVEAFEAAEPGTFDAILMDMQMPVMNGLEATRAIRASCHPDGVRVPIIAVTANAFAGDVQRVLEAGMDVHMAKPLQVDHLGEAVAEARIQRQTALTAA